MLSRCACVVCPTPPRTRARTHAHTNLPTAGARGRGPHHRRVVAGMVRPAAVAARGGGVAAGRAVDRHHRGEDFRPLRCGGVQESSVRVVYNTQASITSEERTPISPLIPSSSPQQEESAIIAACALLTVMILNSFHSSLSLFLLLTQGVANCPFFRSRWTMRRWHGSSHACVRTLPSSMKSSRR